MIDFDEAQRLIGAEAQTLGLESIAIGEAAGRILAEPLFARSDAPRQAVAAMDGYAVIHASTRAGEPQQLIGESRAGAGFAGRVEAGQAVRIFTGAPMPDGADRCIMQEYASRDGEFVQFADGYGPGWHVRAAGSDFRARDMLLDAGTRLGPRAMVAAAAADVADVMVRLRPRVAIIGTGDELQPPGTAWQQPDAIPDSVTFGVAAMVTNAGGVVMDRQTGADDLEALETLAGRALDMADLTIITGGASVGERDFAKAMFAPHGLQLLFEKVAIKPGKPVWVGCAKGRWVLGLPGNPTSAMVTARLFLLPLLARLQGQSTEEVMRWQTLPLAGPITATGGRETFVRARWDDEGLVPTGNQDSGSQAAMVSADWLIRCEAGEGPKAVGQPVRAIAF
nr:molybdopterin molybdotransferase MoeA [uncultured Sphingomonas sp.]